MFTGIISAIGVITSVYVLSSHDIKNSGLRLKVRVNKSIIQDILPGDSVAINGICMTITSKTQDSFLVDMSKVSLNLAADIAIHRAVNIEKALTVTDRIHGYLTSGHIDGIGIVCGLELVGESWKLIIGAPKFLAKYLVYKGPVVVNGVALTINDIQDTTTGGCNLTINLIPYTVRTTTLKFLKINSHVNLEIDMVARYVERMFYFLELNKN